MSVNDDCELHDLVKQTLEKSGSISKIKAELRASVFLALQENGCLQNLSYKNRDLQNFAESDDGILLLCLIREFLEFYGLSFTASVFDPELALHGIECNVKEREKLHQELNLSLEMHDGKQVPVLLKMLKSFRKSQNIAKEKIKYGILNTEENLFSSCLRENDSIIDSPPHITNLLDTLNEIKQSSKKHETKNEESLTMRNSSRQLSSDSKNLIPSDFSKSSLLGNLPPLSPQCHISKETPSNESSKQLNKLKAILKDSALPANDDSTSSIFSSENDEAFYFAKF